MGALIAILHALAVAIPAMAKAFVDVRRAMRKTARVGKDHVRQAVNKGRRKYRIQRDRWERERAKRENAKRRNR